MKKVLFLMVVLFGLTMQVQAQKVSRAVKVHSTELGNQRMEYVGGEFVLIIKTGYSKNIVVPLGDKAATLRILHFLAENKFKAGDVIELENEAGSVAGFNGLKQFIFYSEGRAFSGQMGQRYVKGYIKAVDQFDDGTAKEETETE